MAETERQFFERKFPDYLLPSEYSNAYLFKRDEDGNYAIDFVNDAWIGWLARAKEQFFRTINDGERAK